MCHDSFICDMSLTCVITCSPHRSRQVRVACHIKLEFMCAVTHFTAHIYSRHTHCILYIHHQLEFMCAVTHLYMRHNSFIRDMLLSCVNTCSPYRAREDLVAFYSTRVFKSVWDSSLCLPWLNLTCTDLLTPFICDISFSHVNTCSPHTARRALGAFYPREFISAFDSSVHVPWMSHGTCTLESKMSHGTCTLESTRVYMCRDSFDSSVHVPWLWLECTCAVTRWLECTCAVTHLYTCHGSCTRDMPLSHVSTCSPHRFREAMWVRAHHIDFVRLLMRFYWRVYKCVWLGFIWVNEALHMWLRELMSRCTCDWVSLHVRETRVCVCRDSIICAPTHWLIHMWRAIFMCEYVIAT